MVLLPDVVTASGAATLLAVVDVADEAVVETERWGIASTFFDSICGGAAVLEVFCCPPAGDDTICPAAPDTVVC